MADDKNKQEIESYNRVELRAEKEIDRVYRIYRLLVFALGIIIVVGVTLATMFIGRSITDVEQRVSRQIKEVITEKKIDSLTKEIVKEDAQHYIEVEVNEVLAPFKEKMTNALKKAESDLQKLEDLLAVYITADSAMNGSKKAYLQLKNSIAKEGADIVSIATQYKVREIEKSLDGYRRAPSMYSPLTLNTADGNIPLEEIPHDEIPLDKIVTVMLTKPDMPDSLRHTCMAYINRCPRDEIFKIALTVFESDCLLTCAAFCGVLSEISDEKAEFLDFEGWSKICRKHLDNK